MSYYQNVPVLGRVLAEWNDRPAGALFLLPLWHPVLLAEQIGTLAALHTGPFVMQCAIGPDDNQFPAFGVNVKHRPSRFEESLDIMRRLWAGETVSSEGRWHIQDARISPVPPDGVEVWIGAVARRAIDRAARLGDGWLASPGLTAKQAAAQSAEYHERRQIHGHAETGPVAIRRDIYVGESDEEAQDTARAVVESGYRGFDSEALAIGSPETVAGQFRALEDSGYTDVIVRNLMPTQEHAVASIRRLAEVRASLA
ncbi:MAG: LLM class flavin-dependent oxidoreductase [Dehalococcoidia bacterium]|nr:LLM class flavin-dependent oxidoreductase [Dehalococcoidia bacterium]